MRARRLAARWVLPVDGPPIEHGAVLIGADGRIVAVGPDAARAPARRRAGRGLRGRAAAPRPDQHAHASRAHRPRQASRRSPSSPPGSGGLREAKAARAPEAFLAAARRGLADCWAAGVTTVADTGDSGAVIQALAEAGGSGIAYQEVFGPHPDQRDESLPGSRRQVERPAPVRRRAGADRRLAPRAVHRERAAVRRHRRVGPRGGAAAGGASGGVAGRERAARARAQGRSPRRGAARGIPLPAPARPDAGRMARRARRAVASGRSAFTWCRSTPADIDRLARAGAAVAHCPLSNRAHGHGDAPLAALLAARTPGGARHRFRGERRRARSAGRGPRRPGARRASTPRGALALCTLEGARALGLDARDRQPGAGQMGRLRRHPDAARRRRTRRAEERVLASGPRDVLATFVGGRDVYRSSRPL